MKRLILIMLTVLATTAVAYRLPTAWTLGGGLAYDSVRVTAYRAVTGSATLTNEVDTSFVGAGTSGSFALFVDSLVNYTVRYMYFSGTDTFREFSYGNTPIDYEMYVRANLAAGVTAAGVADAVWDEIIGGSHEISGSSGALVLEDNTTLLNGVWLRARGTDADTSFSALQTKIQAIMDSLAGQSWAATGSLTAAQQDSLFAANARLNAILDSLAGQTWAATGSAAGGCPDSVGDAVTLVAYDSVAGAPIQSAQMALRSSVNGANLAVSPLTGASGAFTFTIASPGTYYVVTRANSVTFPVRTLTVAGGAQTDTVNGGSITVAVADSPDEATVYGTVDCYSCFVRFTLDAPSAVIDTSTNYLISQKIYDLKTNSAGYFSQSLPKTENMVYMSGTLKSHPKWRVVISKTNVKSESGWGYPFSIDADSTSLDIGGLFE